MNDSQRALMEKAQQSLDAAQQLLAGNFVDFAASRAYYAMFYVAQALLEREGLSFSKHAGVIAGFGQHFARTGRVPAAYHRILLKAFEARQSGDYEPIGAVDRAEAEEHVMQAGEFIQLGERLLTATEQDR